VGTYDLSVGTADQGKIVTPDIQVLAGETTTVATVDICAVAPKPPLGGPPPGGINPDPTLIGQINHRQ